jgi:cell division protein FtsX
MSDTAENLHSTTKVIKNDWKSLATLLVTVLTFVVGITWMITGYVLKGAASEIKNNTEKVVLIEARQSLTDSQLANLTKRQDEVIAEIRNDMKTMTTKINSVAESQARVEGVIIGSKK